MSRRPGRGLPHTLLAFRGAGPSGEMAARILDADVRRYGIASVESA